MTRYIDADAFAENFDNLPDYWKDIVDAQPTAEVIEVSQIEHDAAELKAEAEKMKEHIQKDLDKGKEPNQVMVMMLHTSVVSYTALTCLVERYRRENKKS